MPAGKPARPLSLADLLRVAAATLVAGIALAYLIWTFDENTLDGLARIFGVAGLVTAALLYLDALRRREIRQVKAKLDQDERARYWRVYADVMADLGGLAGEDSTDHGRMPPRR